MSKFAPRQLLFASALFLPLGCASEGDMASPPATPPVVKGETLTSGSWSMELPIGLLADRAQIPTDNPITSAKIELGRALYFDPRLSADATVACATCHIPNKGGTDNLAFSVGIRGQKGGRSAPSMLNRVFSTYQFWDGRAPSLEEQAKGPIQADVEMGNTHAMAVATIKGIAGYKPLFMAAFGSDAVDIDLIAKAIATYERVVVAGNAPYDRYKAGETKAMSESAIRGMKVFEDKDKGRCALCHRGHNFTGEDFKALGIGMTVPNADTGRAKVTKNDKDMWKFKTPTLRNVAMTAPYMHDGSLATLADVVEYYRLAKHASTLADDDFKPLNLTAQDSADLVAFMEALTGDILNADKPASLPQ